jgi:hypothetical protein
VSENLPRIKAGAMLPTKATRVGELFVLTGTNAAGIYRVRSLSPLAWVREPNVQTGSEFQNAYWKLASTVVHCNTSLEQVLWLNTQGQDAIIQDVILSLLSGDIHELDLDGPLPTLIVSATDVNAPDGFGGYYMQSIRSDLTPNGPHGPQRVSSLFVKNGANPVVLHADAALFAQWWNAANLPMNPGLPHVLLMTVIGMFLD